MKVFSGTSNIPFSDNILKRLGFDTPRSASIDISRFPDGEIHVKYLENIRGKDVFLIQSLNSISASANDNIMELLLMIDAAKRASAKRITAVIPFFAYARQDRKEQARVPISAKLVANLIVAAGADRILTMDLHSPQIQGFFDIPVDHLQALPAFVKAFRMMQLYKTSFDMDNIIIVAPDVGRSKVAVQYAKALKCNIAIVAKERIDSEEVHSDVLVGDVRNKTAIVMDDLSTTGGTLVAAANLLKAKGAKAVIAGVTHNVLTEKGMQKIQDSCIDKMLVTNTVHTNVLPEKFGVISVDEWFAMAIRAIYNNDSMASFFDV